MERFEDGVVAVAELERCRVPSPRTFFSRSGHWSDMELVAAVQQGLWEVSTRLEKNCLPCVQFSGLQSCPAASAPLQRALAGVSGREEGWLPHKGAHPAAPTPHAAMRTVAYSPGDDTKRVVPQSAHPGMAPAAIVPIIAPGIMRFSDGRATAEELDDSSSELLQMQ